MRPEPQFFRFGQVDSRSGAYVAHSRADDYPYRAPASEFDRLTERAERFDVWHPSKPLTCPYVEIGGSAAEWPPFFGMNCLDRRMLVRDDFLQLMRDNDITGFDCDPVVFEKVRSRKLSLIDRPSYHALVPLGWMDVSLRVYRRERTSDSDQCHFEFEAPDMKDPRIQKIKTEYGKYEYRRMPILSSWDGSDIFRIRQYRDQSLCCTLRLLNLIRDANYKGFFFSPIDALGGYDHELMDFKDRGWPPSTWYPSRQPID